MGEDRQTDRHSQLLYRLASPCVGGAYTSGGGRSLEVICQDRDAEIEATKASRPEGRGMGRWCPPLHPTRGLEERRKLSQRGSMGRKRFLVHFEAKNHLSHHFDSKTATPKDMAGVVVLKLLRQWPIGVLAPPPINRYRKRQVSVMGDRLT